MHHERLETTVCARSLDLSYLVSNCIKSVKTSWAESIIHKPFWKITVRINWNSKHEITNITQNAYIQEVKYEYEIVVMDRLQLLQKCII